MRDDVMKVGWTDRQRTRIGGGMDEGTGSKNGRARGERDAPLLHLVQHALWGRLALKPQEAPPCAHVTPSMCFQSRQSPLHVHSPPHPSVLVNISAVHVRVSAFLDVKNPATVSSSALILTLPIQVLSDCRPSLPPSGTLPCSLCPSLPLSLPPSLPHCMQ